MPARARPLLLLTGLLTMLGLLLASSGASATAITGSASTIQSRAAAVAKPYPPRTGSGGGVGASRVRLGACTTFFGGGYASNSPVRITDNGTYRGTVTTDEGGNFSYEVCFNHGAKCGKHHLVGTGVDTNGDAHTDSADVTVICSARGSGGGNGLPFTGVQWLLGSVVGGSLLIIVGMLLTASGMRHRRSMRRQTS